MTDSGDSAELTPWLSVVIPIFNGEKFLDECLSSVEHQELDGVEIIISDDGSSDRSLEVIDSYVARMPISLVHHRENGNWIDNTNFAVARTRGEFLTFLHQDDMWLPGRLQTIREQTIDHPDVNFWIHNSAYIAVNGERIGMIQCPLGSSPKIVESREFIEHLLVQNFVMMPSPVVRRTSYLSCGGFDPAYWYAGDWDLWLRLGQQGSVGYVPQTLSAFRVHKNSQTWAATSRTDEIRAQFTAVSQNAFDQWTEPSGDVRKTVQRAAELSILLNIWFIDRLHGNRPQGLQLLKTLTTTSPAAIRRFLRDSRILERAITRFRARSIA